MRNLDPLFTPRSVAILGASNDETKYGNWISVQALRMGDRRPLYLVNRRGEPVLGRPTFKRLADLPEPVDLVVITVPAKGFDEAVDDALAAGATAIVAITSGFAELGDEGRATQMAVAERIRAAGAVLLGPNCLGVLDTTSDLFLVSNPLPCGPVGLVSQSGNMALELSKFLADRGLGFSRFASLGNQADLGAADLIRAYARHPGTEVIAAYCEDFQDGRAFVAAAGEAVAAGKPVVLLTVGRSAASNRAAMSHTGALTSGNDVIDAACRAAGVDRVHSPREMADLVAALHRHGSKRARRVAVIADGGGHASTASDIADANGLAVNEFRPSLVAALKAELPPSAGVANPVDLAGAGEQDITSFGRVIDLVLADPDIDSVLVTGYFGGYGDYGPELAAREIATATVMAEHVHRHGKPLALHTMCADSAAADELRRNGIGVFRVVDDAARTLGMLADHADHRPAARQLPPPAEPVTESGYWDARELLKAGGIAFPAARLTTDVLAAAEEIGYPVVLKAMGLLHKSDAGGVAIGLSTQDELRAAHADMVQRLNVAEYCVEQMAGGGVELIVGVRRDSRFGAVLMVGLGGVFAEILKDVAFALAPVTPEEAETLLRGLKAAPLLQGARGRQPVDLAAAAQAVAAISEVGAAHPEIAELEVNPLLATPAGCLGLDARIVLVKN
ncbi:acetate--CoA ligase family protein [Kutzneria sp. CA-103260]|uniref:acetate--CoA ligase family protein n=1 Tax=Kutzneria sp. CA-103260 TaxID=2802641 RepID=UPI001BA48E0D|nr:acetate--CoA ligase family protein [Kutzneria sp. CA-103260]QUQ65806.1 CoA-binding protein [Kutzneria sp. CA-103260]